MKSQIINYINTHEEEIDANQFDWLFAAAPSAGVEKHELMRIFMDAGIEPLRFMNAVPNRSFYQWPGPLTIPDNIESIQMTAFEEALFEEFIVPHNVNHIGGAAFKNCQNLKRLVLPTSIKKIQGWILFHCYNVEEIIYQGTKAEFLSIPEIRRDCFVPGTSIDSYHFKVICTDGEISLREIPS